MDYQFPQQLFPSFYNCGPPDLAPKQCAGNWGSYDRVMLQDFAAPPSRRSFLSRRKVGGETWRHTEPVTVPLLSPKNLFRWPSTPPDPLDFTKHMQNFFIDHCQDAFGCMSEVLGENFYFKEGGKEKCRKDSVHMWKVKNIMDLLNYKVCPQTYPSRSMDMYSALLWDVVPDVPPDLLAPLLHEELTEQRDRMLFSEGATGGALVYVPFSQSDSQSGCLLYPGNQGLDRLNFHRVALQHRRGSLSCVDLDSREPFSVQLKGPVRQISCASLFNNCCVAVRSDHLCGVWRFSEAHAPCLLQVVHTREVATCVCASPHVLGEVLVASESGVTNLWTVGRGMQKVRGEDCNLYFNAKSSWRWCEFSAHPRVMLYADRTGVELTDIRVKPVSSHTLFRISNTPECCSGERLILSRYLGDVHPFQHLVTTQYSAYIMDERFPCVPMLKWDHLMESPPMFCHVICGSASSGSAVGGARTTKVLLGSHSSQEVTLLQYSGGKAEACSSHGSPQALLRPRDSLKHLPVQTPHRLDIASRRLSSAAAGLVGIQMGGGTEAGGEESIGILQLTEAGDIFYQILELEQPDASPPPAAEDQLPPQPAPEEAEAVTSDTSMDEDAIVLGTPQRSLNTRKALNWKPFGLQVTVNDDPEPDGARGSNAGDAGHDAEEPGGAEDTVHRSALSELKVKLSATALFTWKHWLQKLMRKSREKGSRPRRLQPVMVQADRLLHLSDEVHAPLAKKQVRRLRRDLRARMSNRSLLVRGAVSASLGAPDVVAMPGPVDTKVWRDPISRRLTLSWTGEEAWREWWAEQLGLNREKKMEALKKRRRREKEARRAAGHCLQLSGNFSSSEFSDSSVWSSSASQGAWLDSGSRATQQEAATETPRAETPSGVHPDTPAPSPPATTPQSVAEKQGDQQTPGASPSLKPESTPGRRSRNKPAEDCLRILFAPQDESWQQDGYFLEEGRTLRRRPPAAHPSPSQPSRSQPIPARSLGTDPSQGDSVRLGFSQSQSLFQSPQASLGAALQPKKKSRMGF